MSETLSASQYQADLWDLRQTHDVCLFEKTYGEQFKIRVIQAVAVLVLESGQYLLSGMPIVRNFGETALSEFRATFRLIGLLFGTMYLVYSCSLHKGF